MHFAYKNGFKIIGNDISEFALESFFKTFNIPYEKFQNGFQSKDKKIKLYNENLFKISKDFENDLQKVSNIFDRGSLIALTPRQRKDYYQCIKELIPIKAQTLLCACTYNHSEFSGPPHSVPLREIREGFGSHFSINILEDYKELALYSGFEIKVRRGVYLLSKKR